jgi:hypothetical protein
VNVNPKTFLTAEDLDETGREIDTRREVNERVEGTFFFITRSGAESRQHWNTTNGHPVYLV